MSGMTSWESRLINNVEHNDALLPSMHVFPLLSSRSGVPPLVIPAGRWQGSIRTEDQMDAR